MKLGDLRRVKEPLYEWYCVMCDEYWESKNFVEFLEHFADEHLVSTVIVKIHDGIVEEGK